MSPCWIAPSASLRMPAVPSSPPDRSVVIFTDDPGWHGCGLQRVLGERGIASRFVSLADCRLEPGRRPLDVVIPGFTRQPPAAAFVRGVPGGTLEQVILRLDVLHALAWLDIPVMNAPRVIERTVDKGLTTLLLSRAGLPTPRTWVCESAQQARAIVRRELAAGRAIIGKPLFGSQGEGLQLFDRTSSVSAHGELCGGAYYLQRFVERAPGDWSDIRVFVIDGEAVAAMTRRGEHWITNRARGARCERLPLSDELARLAVDASRALGADYAGVDLMLDINNKFQVIEVNGIPAWYGLWQATGMDMAPRLIDTLLSRLPKPDLAVMPS